MIARDAKKLLPEDHEVQEALDARKLERAEKGAAEDGWALKTVDACRKVARKEMAFKAFYAQLVAEAREDASSKDAEDAKVRAPGAGPCHDLDPLRDTCARANQH